MPSADYACDSPAVRCSRHADWSIGDGVMVKYHACDAHLAAVLRIRAYGWSAQADAWAPAVWSVRPVVLEP